MIGISHCQKGKLMREAFQSLFKENPNIEIVESTKSIIAAISATKVHNAAILIVFVNGLDTEEVRRIKEFRETPGAHLMLIGTEEEVEKLGLTCDKFISTSAPRSTFFREIAKLGLKEVPKPALRLVQVSIMDPVTVLTPREHEVSLKVAEGLSNRDIAEDLNLAEQTVKNLVSVVMRKMGCKNRVQVALKLSSSTRPKEPSAQLQA